MGKYTKLPPPEPIPLEDDIPPVKIEYIPIVSPQPIQEFEDDD